MLEVARTFGCPRAAADVAKDRSGHDFDPELVSAFLGLSEDGDFWLDLEQDSVKHTVLSMKPPSRFDQLTEAQIDTVCEVIADFTDVSAQHTWNHSLAVAGTAEGIARQIGLGAR